MALKPAGGKYEGVWINELKNGDRSIATNKIYTSPDA